MNAASARGLAAGKVGDGLTFAIGGGEEIVARYVPAGTFQMGSPAGEDGRDSDETQQPVTLSSHYWMGETEVTQGQWEAVMGSNPSHFKEDKRLPVENVNWNDAQEFIQKLNQQHRLGAGWQWALPSEAEWERACRGGTTGAYAGDLDRMAWYSSNSGGKTHPVGAKEANAYGLYDMHGNVWEWCEDAYQERLPGGEDPLVVSGTNRVFRGGCWYGIGRGCRSADRSRDSPGNRHQDFGFRLAAVPAGR
jgi:formylglycine-generating enzyme required for sulfatase activity